jgi:hypothetical protein
MMTLLKVLKNNGGDGNAPTPLFCASLAPKRASQMGRATAGQRQTASRPHAAFRPAARSLTASVVSGWPPMPHSPLVTSEDLTQGHAAHVLAFDRHHGIAQFLNYLTLLLGIEYVLDEINFYQWHCRSPQW